MKPKKKTFHYRIFCASQMRIMWSAEPNEPAKHTSPLNPFSLTNNTFCAVGVRNFKQSKRQANVNMNEVPRPDRKLLFTSEPFNLLPFFICRVIIDRGKQVVYDGFVGTQLIYRSISIECSIVLI